MNDNPINPWVAIPLVILVVIAGLCVRLAIAGGDIGCMFAEDPALCAAVKGVG